MGPDFEKIIKSRDGDIVERNLEEKIRQFRPWQNSKL